MLCLEATKQLQLALTGRSKHQASGAVISEDRSQRWTFLLPLELGGWIEADIALLLFHVGGVNFYNFCLHSACGPPLPTWRAFVRPQKPLDGSWVRRLLSLSQRAT